MKQKGVRDPVDLRYSTVKRKRVSLPVLPATPALDVWAGRATYIEADLRL